MTGRGIDQVLPHPSNPWLYEPCVPDARQYVHLAESRNRPISRPVDFDYIWDEALTELGQVGADAGSSNQCGRCDAADVVRVHTIMDALLGPAVLAAGNARLQVE